MEKVLREECRLRNDFMFFARIVLFTSLNGLNGRGWSEEHSLLFGIWSSTLGREYKQFAWRSWDFLEDQKLPNGWKPISIFDPVIDKTLAAGAK